jgi:chromate reductase
MNILFFAGALRTDSSNKKFAREAMRVAGALGVKGSFLDLRDYPMPPYDADIEAAGIPAPVKQLAAKIAAADALVISTPEYNGSIPGILKNVIDWLSRDKPVSLTGKHLLLLAASPGALGGVRSLWHSRVPFEVLGVHVFPEMMGLPSAYTAFDQNGQMKEEKSKQQLNKLLEKFIQHVSPKA